MLPTPPITNIYDLKKIYRRRVPKMFYDYCESGSWTEQTFRENVTDFEEIKHPSARESFAGLNEL